MLIEQQRFACFVYILEISQNFRNVTQSGYITNSSIVCLSLYLIFCAYNLQAKNRACVVNLIFEIAQVVKQVQAIYGMSSIYFI